jgi:hypothetical protein
MVLIRLSRSLVSPLAAVIAFLAVIFDMVVHQFPLPGMVVKDTVGMEVLGYFLLFLVFYVAAWVVIKLKLMNTPLGPILVGLFGATLFGVGLHYVEFDRSQNFIWGVLHFILGVAAAYIVVRKFGKVQLVIILIAVVILAVIGLVV